MANRPVRAPKIPAPAPTWSPEYARQQAQVMLPVSGGYNANLTPRGKPIAPPPSQPDLSRSSKS